MVFTKHRGSEIENELYCGKDPDSRFGKILKAKIDMISEEISVGAPRSYLGSHSQSKGQLLMI